jgi:hypothetical protein
LHRRNPVTNAGVAVPEICTRLGVLFCRYCDPYSVYCLYPIPGSSVHGYRIGGGIVQPVPVWKIGDHPTCHVGSARSSSRRASCANKCRYLAVAFTPRSTHAALLATPSTPLSSSLHNTFLPILVDHHFRERLSIV